MIYDIWLNESKQVTSLVNEEINDSNNNNDKAKSPSESKNDSYAEPRKQV